MARNYSRPSHLVVWSMRCRRCPCLRWICCNDLHANAAPCADAPTLHLGVSEENKPPNARNRFKCHDSSLFPLFPSPPLPLSLPSPPPPPLPLPLPQCKFENVRTLRVECAGARAIPIAVPRFPYSSRSLLWIQAMYCVDRGKRRVPRRNYRRRDMCIGRVPALERRFSRIGHDPSFVDESLESSRILRIIQDQRSWPPCFL
ncbi:hypothetical protein V8C37DRAFT_199605 [Trichoderma ceciliae]